MLLWDRDLGRSIDLRGSLRSVRVDTHVDKDKSQRFVANNTQDGRMRRRWLTSVPPL
jgi:hypothetical protein